MRRRLLVVAGVAVVVWSALAAFWLYRVAADAREGRDAALQAREQLDPDEVASQEPLAELRVAVKRFAAAHDRAGGLVLAPLRFAPVIGRQLRSVEALTGAAEAVAVAGVEAVERAGTVLEDPAGAGTARVAQVREIAEIVDDVAASLDVIDDLGPIDGLVAPLADARNDLAADLAEMRATIADARRGARAALSLVEGPRRYLVVAANNAEMRAGSGMWLQGGVLHTEAGRLVLDEMFPLYVDADPPDGAVTPTGDFAERWGFLVPGDEWRNLMASPRFPVSAAMAVEMWRAAGRGDVDGVLAVDAIGLQAIVAATGPVTVGGETLAAADVPQQILHDQYREFGDILDARARNNAERRDALAVLARSAVGAIDSGSYPASTLIRTLGDAVAGRHLLAWTTDPVEQTGWEAAGMDGELEPDSLFVSILNRGVNKLDWFIDVDADLSVTRVGDGWDVAVSLQLRNETPARGEPTYVQGPAPGIDLDPGEYRGIVAVNVPADARDARFDGVGSLAVAGADGPTRVVGFQLDLPRRETRVVVLRFRLPGETEQLVVEPSARVPTISWRYRAGHWEDSSSRVAKF